MYYMSKKQNRQLISIRLEPETIELLDTVQTLEGTRYANKTRTWLIEHATKRVYGDIVKANGNQQ